MHDLDLTSWHEHFVRLILSLNEFPECRRSLFSRAIAKSKAEQPPCLQVEFFFFCFALVSIGA